MAKYFENITPFSQHLQKKGYQGRSPYDEYFYDEETNVSRDFMRDQRQRKMGNIDKNRNFSALNQTPEQKRYIVDQSYLRMNLKQQPMRQLLHSKKPT